MSKSVWFEEIDRALIEFISSKVQLYSRGKGVLVPVPVSIRKPEEDFKVEHYPSITLANLYSEFSIERYNKLESVVSVDIEKHEAVVEESALSFDLSYQIDFWSMTAEHMNEMTLQWLSRTGRHFNLPVVDKSGEQRSSFVLLRDTLKRQDYFQGDKRLLHSFLTYRIYVELDEGIRRTVPIVTSTETDPEIMT